MKRKYIWPIIICSVVLISLALLGNLRLWGQSIDVESLSAESSGSFIFRLEIADLAVVEDYDACSGLGSSNDIEENTIVTEGGTIVRQKTPGALKWNSIVLKRIRPSNMLVVDWRRQLETGNLYQVFRSGTVTMYWSGSSEPLARWAFQRGWPASLVFNGSEEELIIVHEGIQRVTSSTEVPGVPSRR